MKIFYKRLLSIGIAMGVFCALVVFTAGQTQWTAMELRKKALESNIYKIIYSPKPSTVTYMGLNYARQIQSLLPDEVISDLKASGHNAAISFESEPLPNDEIMGTDCNLAVLMGLQIITGRYLSSDDINGYKKVCVLKSNVYDMVKTRNATHIDINGDAYEIVGVVSGNEGNGGFRDTGDVFVPVTTLYKYIERTGERAGLIKQIVLNKDNFSKEQILNIMQEKALLKGIDISGLKLLPQQYNELEASENFLKSFSLIFLLSLLVLMIAAFNIIHIATASIMDREREIGLRTALGAKPYHITAHITVEILFCALRGGIAGVAAASILNTIANLGLGKFGLSFNAISISAGILLAAMAGLLTSLIPAAKAARLDPIAALREE